MQIIRIIHKFKYILSKHQKVRIVQLALMMVVGGILETFSISLVLPFMNAVMNPEELMDKWYVKYICEALNIQSVNLFMAFLGILLSVLYILKNAYLIIEYNIQYRFVYHNMFSMQRRLLQTFISHPYEFFLNVNSGEIIRIINTDTYSAFSLLITLLGLFTEFVASFMLVAAIFVIAPLVTLAIMIVLILLMLVIMVMIRPKLKNVGYDQQLAGTGMNKWLLQSIQGIKEIKVLDKEDFFLKNYYNNGKVYIHSLRKSQTLSIVPRFLIEGISMGAMFLVVSFLILNGFELEKVIPILTAVAMAAIRLLPSANRISSALAQVAYSEPMVDKVITNLQDMENYEHLKNNDHNIVCAEKKDLRLLRELSFERVSYHYPNVEEDILTEASLTIQRGESVGIIGPSGAGKTTSIDLLLGLLIPQKGSICVDDIDIHQNIGLWLQQIGYIPQMIFMLDDTIRANVAFGEEPEEISENKIWEALSKAALDDYVRKLPKGLDTEIGERGVRISGGQRQRIGIARALYRNPEILVFDEATSALDHETENAIMESIHNLHGQKTMIIIAHRLTTIESCDHIYRVEKGKIMLER